MPNNNALNNGAAIRQSRRVGNQPGQQAIGPQMARTPAQNTPQEATREVTPNTGQDGNGNVNPTEVTHENQTQGIMISLNPLASDQLSFGTNPPLTFREREPGGTS